ncbi:hypothetical protein [Sphingosinicella sp.]|uniref:hypothetical protein n=1 Tax=Sphingosinicella sp. TaxID=1917971 RepID=UPI0040381987
MTDTPPEDSAAPANAGQAGGASSYTAVIHFHGIGSQRRFEESAGLVDALDRYSNASKQDEQPIGKLARIQARSELLHSDPKRTIGYIRSFWTEKTPDGWTPYQQVRFYESYWAPVMAGQQSPWRIVRWIFSQVWRPWTTMRAPWRERQRLRRAALAELFDREDLRPDGAEPGDFGHLVKLYDEFEGLDAQRTYPAGGFDDFLAHIGASNRGKPDRAARLTRVARAWCRHYQRDERRAFFVLVTIALTLLLVAGATVFAIRAVLQLAVAVVNVGASPGSEIAGLLTPDWRTALGLAGGLFALLLGKLLVDYMGDVEAWSTYRETDEKHERRRKVLDTSIELVTHVLADARCTRVVVVSHSLGTTIANDTLLAIARNNRATNPQDPLAGPAALHKIEHFVTLGSPIDKIEYFFESYSSRSHRYKRIIEELRGDIGTEPFSRNRKPYVHWINYWDEGDIISGPLHSPTNRERVAHLVDNVHVRSFGFPAPGASHLAYLDSRNVVRGLFDIIYKRAGSFRTLPIVPDKGPDYRSVDLGPGEARGDRRFYQLTALALPWLALMSLAVGLLTGRWTWWLFVPGALALLILVLGHGWSRARGHRDPF